MNPNTQIWVNQVSCPDLKPSKITLDQTTIIPRRTDLGGRPTDQIMVIVQSNNRAVSVNAMEFDVICHKILKAFDFEFFMCWPAHFYLFILLRNNYKSQPQYFPLDGIPPRHSKTNSAESWKSSHD